MKTLFKSLFMLLLLAVLGVTTLVFSSRYHDGPLTMEGYLGLVPGGPFSSGEVAPRPADWNFLQDRQLVEFQTLTPARSRTVWLGVHEGRLFLVSGYMQTWYGGLWKHWPHDIPEDDRIILRVDGNLYEQRLQRIDGGELVAPVLNEYRRKYGDGLGEEVTDDSPVVSGSVWMYEVVDR